jgi:hypothetical protein
VGMVIGDRWRKKPNDFAAGKFLDILLVFVG